MKRLLLLTVLWCIGVACVFADETYSYTNPQGVTWSCSAVYDAEGAAIAGQAEITAASGYGTEVEVPGTVYDSEGTACTVVKMSGVFTDNTELQKVTLPTSVTVLDGTFNRCSALTTVENTSQIAEIGSFSFQRTALTSIDLSACKAVAYQAFAGCTALESINLPACTSIGNNVFSGCTSLTSADLPLCATMGSEMFSGCTALTTVNMPACTSLGNDAFKNCTALASLDLSSVESLDFGTFRDYTSLTSIKLSSCKTVEYEAFSGCTSLTSIDLPACTTMEFRVFDGCTNLTSINLPLCTTVGDWAFNNCNSLTSIDLPSCQSIADYAFYRCTGLASVKLSDNCTDIGEMVFYNCGNLTSVSGLGSVKKIGYGTFGSCSSLRSVDLADCTEIGGMAFYDCSKLTTVGSLAKVTSIGGEAFRCCSSLTSVDLSSCTSLGDYAFHGCANLTGVVGLQSLTQIPDYAFANCPALTSESFDLSATTTIGQYAFCECTSLTSLNITAKCTRIDANAFSCCSSLTTAGDLSGVTKIGDAAFQYCSNLKSIGSLSNVISIESYAFCDCSGLAAVTLPATLTELGGGCFAANTIVTIGAVTPPTLTYPVLGDFIVKVPDDALDTYKTATGWSNYAANIFAMGDVLDYAVTTTALEATSGLLNAVGKDNADKVVTLKVDGTINGYDIMVMRNKFTHLTQLDLSDATIVANDYEYYTGCHTTDSVVGDNMFRELKIRRIVLPKTTKYIGSSAFFSSAVEDVQMYSGIKSIGDAAFQWCNRLKSIVLPNTVGHIGPCAFEYCTNLVSVEVPSSLKTIKEYAFYGCNSLNSINLSLAETIGYYAFGDCSSLEEVKIPSSLQSIGDEAFKNCNSLNRIYTYTVEPVSINQNTFSTYSTATLYVPEQAWDNYYWNTEWSQFRELKEFNEPYTYFYLNNEYTLNDRFDGTPDIDVNPGGGLIVPESEQEDQEAGDVHVKSDSNNWASIIANGNLDADSLHFDITVDANIWYFFSFPFKVKRSNISCGNAQYVFRYYDGETRAEDGSTGWTDLPDGQEYLEAGCGYIFQASAAGTLSLKIEKEEFGNLPAVDVSTELDTYASATEQNANWNFVGNATTGFYDINDLVFTAPITRWNSETNTYEALRPGDDDYTLHPFEAFFVQSSTDTETVEFDADKRMTETGSQESAQEAKKMAVRRAFDPNRQFVNLTLTDGKTTDKTRVVFNESKSSRYEKECDAAKFEAAGSVSLYTVESQAGKLAINERQAGSVQLGFNAPAEGTYTLSAMRMDKPVMLRDNETQTTFDLTTGDYSFSSKAGAHDARFVLLPDTRTGIADLFKSTGVNIYPGSEGINISGLDGQTANVYSMDGVRYAACTQDGFISLPKATYIVEVGSARTKLMVK